VTRRVTRVDPTARVVALPAGALLADGTRVAGPGVQLGGGLEGDVVLHAPTRPALLTLLERAHREVLNGLLEEHALHQHDAGAEPGCQLCEADRAIVDGFDQNYLQLYDRPEARERRLHVVPPTR
jgi:hypothetical protein